VWLASLQAAADFLRARSGKTELCVFGALIGGTLATVFAASRTDVSGLVLWGALPSGRALLRELIAFRAVTPANSRGARASDWEEGDQEAVGFLITRATADQIAALDLLKLEGRIARVVAVFRRNRALPVEPLVEHLRRAGAEVHVQPRALVDIAEIEDDHAQPPYALLDEMLAWWTRAYPEVSASLAERALGEALDPSVHMQSRRGVPVEESVVRFGDDGGIFGIVTRVPDARDARKSHAQPAVVFVNGGGTHRAGINRNYTEWARDLAARGLLALRIDLRGLGDSPPLRPEHLGVLRRDDSRKDIRDAVTFLQRQLNASSVTCVGLCLGGYQAFHSALEDSRISGLVMLNPLRFRPVGEGPSKELQYLALTQYARAALTLDPWVRLARGRVNVRGIAKSVATRGVNSAAASVRALKARLAGGRAAPATWIAEKFVELTERGCHVLLVFSAGDGIVELFEEEIALDRARLQATGRLAIEVMHDTDHIFTPLFSQERVGEILERALVSWTQS
jgi:dienelactone hydrolase